MTNCNDRTYKFAKGVHIDTYTLIDDEMNVDNSTFKLLITDVNGTTIAIVNPDYVQYGVSSKLLFDDNERHNKEYLTGDGFKIDLESSSLMFQGEEFTINSGNDTYDHIVIGKSDMDLTSYGQEVLGECFKNTTKYYVPTFNDHDHSSDYSTNDNLNTESEVQYSLMMDLAIF